MANRKRRRRELRRGDRRLIIAGVTALAILIAIYAMAS